MNNYFDEQKNGHDDESINDVGEAKPELSNSNEYIKVKPKKKYNFITYISLVQMPVPQFQHICIPLTIGSPQLLQLKMFIK